MLNFQWWTVLPSRAGSNAWGDVSGLPWAHNSQPYESDGRVVSRKIGLPERGAKSRYYFTWLSAHRRCVAARVRTSFTGMAVGFLSGWVTPLRQHSTDLQSGGELVATTRSQGLRYQEGDSSVQKKVSLLSTVCVGSGLLFTWKHYISQQEFPFRSS